ncbi:hypothetical protein ACPWSR_13080 [Alloiococcus sp. CFN-8]|uniref:hypothetical protein n=1 Tax=Alloiococcus sp. CFN-8 TaxID=3416081 RepID=UPI003CEE37B7
MEIYKLGDRYAIASENEELFCDEFVKDNDLSLKEYQGILRVFGAVTEEQIFFNPWDLCLEVRNLSYFTTLEDCKEAIDYLNNRVTRSWIVYCYSLMDELEKLISISQIFSFLKNPSPYRAHYRCAQETVKIYGENISGSHFTFYRGSNILADFVFAEEKGVYLIDCSKEDIWDALKECKPVNEDCINRF